MLIASAEFQFVAAVNPAQGTGIIERIFVAVARSRNWIADGGVAVDLNERRADGDIKAGRVTEPETRGGCVIGALAIQEFIPKEREAQNAHQGGIECVRFLSDKILRALVLPYGKSGNAGAGRGNGIELVVLVEHVAKIERVAC